MHNRFRDEHVNLLLFGRINRQSIDVLLGARSKATHVSPVRRPGKQRQPMHAKGDPRKANPHGDALARLRLQHGNNKQNARET